MTTEELAELFLAHLYDLADEAPHPNFLFSVNDFSPKWGMTGREEIQKAMDYLGDRGFIILASLDRFDGMSAGITMEGSAFVEKGGETGMIQRYRRNLQESITTPSVPPPPVVDSGRTETANEERRDSFYARCAMEAILEDIEDSLEKDDTLAADAKKDLLSDLVTLKVQMERNVRNRQIIHLVLSNLSSIPSIAPLVTGLNGIIETYFR